jgi:hypothetical protein
VRQNGTVPLRTAMHKYTDSADHALEPYNGGCQAASVAKPKLTAPTRRSTWQLGDGLPAAAAACNDSYLCA